MAVGVLTLFGSCCWVETQSSSPLTESWTLKVKCVNSDLIHDLQIEIHEPKYRLAGPQRWKGFPPRRSHGVKSLTRFEGSWSDNVLELWIYWSWNPWLNIWKVCIRNELHTGRKQMIQNHDSFIFASLGFIVYFPCWLYDLVLLKTQTPHYTVTLEHTTNVTFLRWEDPLFRSVYLYTLSFFSENISCCFWNHYYYL